MALPMSSPMRKSKGGGSSSMRVALLFCFAGAVFVAGLLVGTTFFDIHDGSNAANERPWEKLTQRAESVTNRLLRTGDPSGAAAAGGQYPGYAAAAGPYGAAGAGAAQGFPPALPGGLPGMAPGQLPGQQYGVPGQAAPLYAGGAAAAVPGLDQTGRQSGASLAALAGGAATLPGAGAALPPAGVAGPAGLAPAAPLAPAAAPAAPLAPAMPAPVAAVPAAPVAAVPAAPAPAPALAPAAAPAAAAPAAPAAAAAAAAAAPAAPAAPPVKPTSPPSSSLAFSGQDYVEADGPLDADDMTAMAWIKLDAQDQEQQLKTIVANRNSGCSVDPSRDGFAFYVNEWNTANRALKVDWGNRNDGCATLMSEPATIPLGEWTHVGVAFQGARDAGTVGTVMLFKDAQLLKRAACTRSPQRDNRLRIGMHADSLYGFKGRIAHVALLHSVVTPEQLAFSMGQVSATQFTAFAAAVKSRAQAVITLDDSGGVIAVKDIANGHLVTVSPGLSRAPSAAGLGGAFAAAGGGDAAGGAPVVPADVAPPAAVSGGGANKWTSHVFKMPASMVTGDVTDKAALAAGTFSDDISASVLAESDRLGKERALRVKAAMQHCWKGYKDHAWGADEVKPRSGNRQENWGGMGMTLIDSLDVLWIMGMKAEFEEAAAWVQSSLSFNKPRSVSVFETNIRAVGGLLAAYDLSKKPVFLEKAKDVASRLLPAFNTPSGIPRNSVHLTSGSSSNPSWTGSSSILSELGTMQVEFRYLSKHTGDANFGRKVEAVIETLNKHRPSNGLYPIYINPRTGAPANSHITFGALGDSFYEYLLKTWLQGGKKEPMYREMYDRAMDGLTELLLKRTSPSNLLYVSDFDGSRNQHKMDHLVCFVPGMLALGAYSSQGTAGERNWQRDLANAKALAYTCYQMYERMATGLSAEYVEFRAGQDLVAAGRAPFYLLRPEASESMFILHQLTGNPIYREWGWKMFEAMEKYCKVAYGYGAYPDVRDTNRVPDDRQESFFLAETLKYLYLLQDPEHDISLERYVFNTEAHPLSVWS